ncbi:NUDIX domain-containing protein [Candidatus Daviesbacteria bacterium]|nr:NUDIX domain-containing protein [Candidatus Daviesbacteria bacterium]
MKKGVDYIGVGVGAAIIKNGKILITKRGKKSKNEIGKWEIPGGSVEFGETFREALIREVKEALDIKIEVVELLGICDHIILGEKQHWVSPTYLCKIKKGKPKIKEPEKCEEIGWFSLEEASKLPLSIVTLFDIKALQKKFPKGLSNFK